jgi:hypothetical protein
MLADSNVLIIRKPSLPQNGIRAPGCGGRSGTMNDTLGAVGRSRLGSPGPERRAARKEGEMCGSLSREGGAAVTVMGGRCGSLCDVLVPPPRTSQLRARTWGRERRTERDGIRPPTAHEVWGT